jgi:hypothetical protein
MGESCSFFYHVLKKTTKFYEITAIELKCDTNGLKFCLCLHVDVFVHACTLKMMQCLQKPKSHPMEKGCKYK